MKTKKLISKLFFTTLLINSVAMAEPAKPLSSDIPLGIFNIKPGEELNLPLDKLYVGVKYEVICTIQYQNQSNEEYSHIALSCPANGIIWRDGDRLGTCSANNVISYKTKGSRLTISEIHNYSQVAIRNLDYTDATSANCIAAIDAI